MSDVENRPLREAMREGRLTPKVIRALGQAILTQDYAALLDLSWSAPPTVVRTRTKTVRGLLEQASVLHGRDAGFLRVQAVLLDGLAVFAQPSARAHYSGETSTSTASSPEA